MLSDALTAKFAALGVDINRASTAAEALLVSLDNLNLPHVEQLAVLRLCEGAIRYDEEHAASTFEGRAAELLLLLGEADLEARAEVGD